MKPFQTLCKQAPRLAYFSPSGVTPAKRYAAELRGFLNLGRSNRAHTYQWDRSTPHNRIKP